MSALPPGLTQTLAEATGLIVTAVVPLGGGMINRAARLTGPDGGDVVVKWKADAPPGFFGAEADGLARLHAAGALRVPQVLTCREYLQASTENAAALRPDAPDFLLLEYVPPHSPADTAAFARRFGEALARQHREAASPSGAFGLERDNFIGSLPQPNTPHARWPDFYRQCRLLPQIAHARAVRLLTPERERLLMALVERLDALCDGLPARPVLLHGDLWSGNFLSAGPDGSVPVVFDPAVYYGEREIEIAYIELFSDFPPGFLDAYCAAFPLDDGYERRRALHQLYPLLVHLNHFGETYGPLVERACREYVR